MYAIYDYETGNKIKGGFADELEAHWHIEANFLEDCYVDIERKGKQ